MGDEFLCRRCRHLLFREDHLGTHKPHAHHISRRKLHAVKGNRLPVVDCTSFFLRDDTGLDWLAGLSDVEGKLSCPHPHCGVRIGSFNWSGTQCSCGTWVVPAIQVPMSKVDRKVLQPAVLGLEEEEGGSEMVADDEVGRRGEAEVGLAAGTN